MTTKPLTSIDVHTACTLAIAAGTASEYAAKVTYGTPVHTALEKLSLRFAELALEALGGESGQGTGDEAASA